MRFTEAINSGFVNVLNYSGRASRSEYWFFQLFCFLVSLLLYLWHQGVMQGKLLPELALIFLLFIPLNISLSVRRLHDTGRSGYWIALPLVPIFGIIAIFVLYEFHGIQYWSDVGLVVSILSLLSVVFGCVLVFFMVLPSNVSENQYEDAHASAKHFTDQVSQANTNKNDELPEQKVVGNVSKNSGSASIPPKNAIDYENDSDGEKIDRVPSGSENHNIDKNFAFNQEFEERISLILEYRDGAADTWREVQKLPMELQNRFIKKLREEPNLNLVRLSEELHAEHRRLMRPYGSEDANDALEDARTISLEAEHEFVKVYDLLAPEVAPAEIVKRLEKKYGPTARSILVQQKELEKKQRAKEERMLRLEHEAQLGEKKARELSELQLTERRDEKKKQVQKRFQERQQSYNKLMVRKKLGRVILKRVGYSMLLGLAVAVTVKAVMVHEREVGDIDLNRVERQTAELALKALGYGDLEVDGFFEYRSIEAVKRWQDDNGFSVTGQLTRKQLNGLLKK